MRIVSTLIIAATCFIFTQARSQGVIWGAGSTNPVADSIGTFAVPFGNPNGWTNVNGNNNAFFVRTTTGTTQGAYATGLPPINSPSMANGAAHFDSDYMDNGGIQGNFGNGVAPSPHSATLFSPFFDLTGYTDSTIAAEFYLYYRNFSIQTMTVGISTDSGATWSDFSFNQNVAVNAIFYPTWVTVSLPNVLNGQADLTGCQLRFVVDMDYYFIMFDDLRLVTQCPIIDTAVTVVNETLTSQATGVTYQWVTCPGFAVAPGNSTDSTYTASANGDYAVIVSSGNCTDTSACFTILSTELSSVDSPELVRIYPNPSNGIVTIRANQATVCSIADELGKEVMSFELNNTNNNSILLSDLAPGCYIITVVQAGSASVHKLVILE